jgi:hypothetical protein
MSINNERPPFNQVTETHMGWLSESNNQMTGETDLNRLLSSMAPRLLDDEFVFFSIPGAGYGDHADLSPKASFIEDEGLTLVITRDRADQAGIPYGSVFRCITLTVHSNLDAVGFTAAVSRQLAKNGICANVTAAYYHDHIFVTSGKEQRALAVLDDLTRGFKPDLEKK